MTNSTSNPQVEEFLKSKGASLDTASKELLSEAYAYSVCYDWYINKQNVTHDNAVIASKVWVQKYALHDDSGICLETTPEDMWRRIANELAKIEVETNRVSTKTESEWATEFYSLFEDFKYVLGGSGLSAIGNHFSSQSSSNCFVLASPGDSLNEIFDTCKSMATVQKYRGGTGFDISKLRPAKAKVSNSAKYSSGAVSFMDLFSKVTSTVGQAGRCIAHDQLVLTNRGYLQIKNVLSGDLIWTRKGWIKNLETVNNGIKPVYKIVTRLGFELHATDNHILVSRIDNSTGVVTEAPLSSFKVGDNIVMISDRNTFMGSPNGDTVFTDAVAEIALVSNQEVYDLKLESEHLFYCQGFLVHNSGATMLSIDCNHPDIEAFIDEKRDLDKQWFFDELSANGIDINDWKYAAIQARLKSTTKANISVKATDDFMNAVKEDKDFTLSYEFEDEQYPAITKEVKARQIWNKLVAANVKCAEPGILFWDTIRRNAIPDCYGKVIHNFNDKETVTYDFTTVSTNPCLIGSTKVAVADGRGHVTIKELADAGEDVPVYCLNNNKGITVRTLRNPRITGYNQPITRIEFEGGHSIKCTLNHKIMLSDGSYKEAKDFVIGDSVAAFYKEEGCIKDIFPSANSNSSLYYHWKTPFATTSVKFDHRLIYEYYAGSPIPSGHVIHHKDYNSRNNCISNLQLMTKHDHDMFHAQDMLGEKNPVFKILADPEKATKWKANLSKACSGSLNGNCYSDVTNKEIYAKAVELTKSLGRRFSRKEWQSFAELNKLPLAFTDYRAQDLGSVLELAHKVATELGLGYCDKDPRLVATYLNMVKQGYDAEIIDNVVYVDRVCETCGNVFKTPHEKREVSFCSLGCSSAYLNTNPAIKESRIAGVRNYAKNRANELRHKQAKTLLDLTYELKRQPLRAEWETKCKSLNIPFRLGGSEHMFKNYSDLLEASKNINHRVIAIEMCEPETVYNGTVDEFHNFFIGGFDELNDKGNHKFFHINNRQCGELPLSANDACSLGSLCLYSFVEDKFKADRRFNWKKFMAAARLATRIQDNVREYDMTRLPLEENVIPAKLGRRIGVGIHGLADALAALGLKYGSPEAEKLTSKILEQLKNIIYDESVTLGQEKGVFPIWNWEVERDNPFLNRLDSNVLSRIKTLGRRNIACQTIAPTGSVSILSRNCSSGIEPCFKISYTRAMRKQGSEETEQLTIYHQAVQDCIDAGGDISVFVEANNVDWESRVRMQAACQKHIDHSISSTVNLPAGTPEETVSNIYMKAWESGLKGITIYVEGSRTGVLGSTEKPKQVINKGFERPKTTEVDIHKVKYKDQSYMILIGKVDSRPIEVFGGVEDGVSLPTKYHKAELTKKSRGQYTLTVQLSEDDEDDVMKINNIGARFPAHDIITITRFISLALRNGIKLSDIVEQLQKSSSSIYSAPAVFARILKLYISDEELVEYAKSTGKKCPDCDSPLTFKREGGCITEVCLNCSYTLSKCS